MCRFGQQKTCLINSPFQMCNLSTWHYKHHSRSVAVKLNTLCFELIANIHIDNAKRLMLSKIQVGLLGGLFISLSVFHQTQKRIILVHIKVWTTTGIKNLHY